MSYAIIRPQLIHVLFSFIKIISTISESWDNKNKAITALHYEIFLMIYGRNDISAKYFNV